MLKEGGSFGMLLSLFIITVCAGLRRLQKSWGPRHYKKVGGGAKHYLTQNTIISSTTSKNGRMDGWILMDGDLKKIHLPLTEAHPYTSKVKQDIRPERLKRGRTLMYLAENGSFRFTLRPLTIICSKTIHACVYHKIKKVFPSD